MRERKTRRLVSDEVIGTAPDGADTWQVHLVTEVHYGKGGMSMFSGEVEARGYWLAVRIERRRDESDAGTVRVLTQFALFTGGRKLLLEPAKAFSAKRLAAVPVPEDKADAMRATMRAQFAREEAEALARRERYARVRAEGSTPSGT